MKNRSVILVILLALLVLVVVFLTVDFNLSRSDTTSKHQQIQPWAMLLFTIFPGMEPYYQYGKQGRHSRSMGRWSIPSQ